MVWGKVSTILLTDWWNDVGLGVANASWQSLQGSGPIATADTVLLDGAPKVMGVLGAEGEPNRLVELPALAKVEKMDDDDGAKIDLVVRIPKTSPKLRKSATSMHRG